MRNSKLNSSELAAKHEEATILQRIIYLQTENKTENMLNVKGAEKKNLNGILIVFVNIG